MNENDPRYVPVAEYAELLQYMILCAADISDGRDKCSETGALDEGLGVIDETLHNMREKLLEKTGDLLDLIACRGVVLELPKPVELHTPE